MTTTAVRRHGDVPARQPHRQVRRRVPRASSTTASARTRARSPTRASRRSSRASATRSASRSATARRTTCYVNAIGAFVQDSISLGSNLKLDLGLRYDYLPSPTEADDKLVAFDPATVVAACRSAPRLRRRSRRTAATSSRASASSGIRPATARLVVRGAYAVMVNQTNTGYFAGETGNPPLATPLRRQAAARPRATSSSTTRCAGRVAALAPTFTDPELPARPHADVERQRRARDRRRLGVMVGYFGSHGDRLRIPININQF